MNETFNAVWESTVPNPCTVGKLYRYNKEMAFYVNRNGHKHSVRIECVRLNGKPMRYELADYLVTMAGAAKYKGAMHTEKTLDAMIQWLDENAKKNNLKNF